MLSGSGPEGTHELDVWKAHPLLSGQGSLTLLTQAALCGTRLLCECCCTERRPCTGGRCGNCLPRGCPELHLYLSRHRHWQRTARRGLLARHCTVDLMSKTRYYLKGQPSVSCKFASQRQALCPVNPTSNVGGRYGM